MIGRNAAKHPQRQRQRHEHSLYSLGDRTPFNLATQYRTRASRTRDTVDRVLAALGERFRSPTAILHNKPLRSWARRLLGQGQLPQHQLLPTLVKDAWTRGSDPAIEASWDFELTKQCLDMECGHTRKGLPNHQTYPPEEA